MKTLMEVFKTILPAIITFVGTLFLTKYTYNKDAPLDKMEKAYDEIYYPLYKIICSHSNYKDIHNIKILTRYNTEKNRKFMDRSTIIIMELVEKEWNCKTYQKLKNNIYIKCSYLRRRLGYLEPNIIQIYSSSSDSTQIFIRMVIYMIVMYFAALGYSVLKNKLQYACSVIFEVAFLFAILGVIHIILRKIKNYTVIGFRKIKSYLYIHLKKNKYL